MARQLMERFAIVPRRPELPIDALSGGNQQKVMLARWLRTKPVAMLLDEPTQGVDIAGRAQIQLLIKEAAAEGCGFLVSSSEVEGLVALCDRVVVLRRGRLETILSGERKTVREIQLATFGKVAAAV